MNKINAYRIRIAAILIFALVIQAGIPAQAAQIKVSDTGSTVSANSGSDQAPINITVGSASSDKAKPAKSSEESDTKPAQASNDPEPDRSNTPAATSAGEPESDPVTINISKPTATPTPTATPIPTATPATKSVTAPSSTALSDKEDRAAGGGSRFSIKSLGAGLRSLFGNGEDEDDEEDEIERNGAPGENTDWQDKFEYDLVSDNGIDYIELTRYKNTTSHDQVNIEAMATISGNDYITRLTDSNLDLFRGCDRIESLSINGADISELTTTERMFEGCRNLKKVKLSNFDTSNVGDMSMMFLYCASLEELDFDTSALNTVSVGSMSGMFYGCSSLKTIDLSKFKTEKVEYMTAMFLGCSGLTSVNAAGMNTSRLKYLGRMFEGCSSLENVNLDFADEVTPYNTDDMFKGCSSLSSLNLSRFNMGHPESSSNPVNMLEGCTGLVTIDIPTNLSEEVDLPDEFVRADDRTVSYTSLPQGEQVSFRIIKGQAYVSVNEITLSGNSGAGEMSDGKLTVYTNEAVTISANVGPENATNKDIIWKFSTPASGAASYSYTSENGILRFTGITPGVVTVRAESADGPFAECQVTVINNPHRVASISLNRTNVPALEKKRTVDLTATVNPDSADNLKINWSVVPVEPVNASNVVELGDPVSVNNTSTVRVTGKSVGEVRIIATSDDNNNVVSECRVKVVKTKASEIRILSGNKTINVNKTLKLAQGEGKDYIILPNDATEIGVTYRSSNESIATVDAATGLVTGKGEGQARIIITADQDDPTVSADIIVNVKRVPVTSINLIPQDRFLYTGYTFNRFTVNIEPEEPTDPSVEWSSTDTDVATVDQNGKVTARGEGECDIIVTTRDGTNLSSKCHLTVEDIKKHIVSITLIEPTDPILKGNTIGLSYIITPDDATDQTLFWESSNENIAKVDENGKVKGVSPGRAMITVRTQDGGHTDSCWVEVTSRPTEVTSIVLKPTSYQMYVGQNEIISATVLPEKAVDKKITWSSNNEAVAVVSPTGLVTAVGIGEAEIKAEASNGVSSICYIRVTRLPQRVTGMYVTPLTKNIYVGQSFTITAVIEPKDADNKDIMWSSDDDNIATVNSKGKVTGKKKGTATITAVTADGGFTATCEVTVKNKPIDPTPKPPQPWPTPTPDPDDKDKNKIRIVDERTIDAPNKDRVRAYLDRVPGDWYLIISDSNGDTLKPRIYGDSSLAHNRAVFFKIRVLDSAGNEVKDFGKLTIRIPLISDMDIKNGTVRVVAVNGDGIDKSISSSTGTDGDMAYVTFTTNHNGEHAILYTLNQSVIDYYNNYYRVLADQYNAANGGQVRVLDHVPRTGYGKYDK